MPAFLILPSAALVSLTATSTPAVQNSTPSWTANVNLNANVVQSNQDVQSFFVDFRALNKLKLGNQMELSGLYAITKQSSGNPKTTQTTEDRWTVAARYDAPSSTRKFGFIDQRFERNRIVDLNLRSITSAGFSYYAARSENPIKTGRVSNPGDIEWRIDFGISYLTESYAAGLGERSQVGLQLGSGYRRVLRGGINLQHNLSFVPAFNDLADYFVVSNLSIGLPLSDRMTVALNWISDFDTTPAPGARKDNNRYALTLGYRF